MSCLESGNVCSFCFGLVCWVFFIFNFAGRGNWVCAQIHVQETVHIRNISTSIESAVLLPKFVQGMIAGMNARGVTSVINKGQVQEVNLLL